MLTYCILNIRRHQGRSRFDTAAGCAAARSLVNEREMPIERGAGQ